MYARAGRLYGESCGSDAEAAKVLPPADGAPPFETRWGIRFWLAIYCGESRRLVGSRRSLDPRRLRRPLTASQTPLRARAPSLDARISRAVHAAITERRHELEQLIRARVDEQQPTSPPFPPFSCLCRTPPGR